MRGRDYNVHVVNYVWTHFEHLLTEVERAAGSAFVLKVSGSGGGERQHVTFPNGTSEEVASMARQLLMAGQQEVRRSVAGRLLDAHRAEIHANACPKCGRLPATPRAKMCIWCSHSWREGA